MNRRLIKGLRIAWTMVFGILCLLLIGLWVRSYWGSQSVAALIGSKRIAASSFLGGMYLSWEPRTGNQMAPLWTYTSRSRDEIKENLQRLAVVYGKSPILSDRSFVFRRDIGKYSRHLFAPHWSLALPLLMITAVSIRPWLRWRFSLRTLMLATTLIAMILGLAVWSLRT